MKQWRTIFSFVTVLFLSGGLVSAGNTPSAMEKGLAELNSGKYSTAMTFFEQAVTDAPANVQARYCLGVAYQYLNRLHEARIQYEYVAKNATDPALVRRANKGLAGCPEHSTSFGISPEPRSNPSNVSTAATENQPPVAAGDNGSIFPNKPRQVEPRQSGFPSVQSPFPAVSNFSSGGTPRIVDVYTDWCGPCKRFRPTFDEARNVYAGKIQFDSINAEAAENGEFVKQYRQQIRGYPTIMMFSGDGTLVFHQAGAPRTLQDFQALIKEQLKVDP